MSQSLFLARPAAFALAGSLALLTACGGGGSAAEGPGASPLALKGTAAVGSAVAHASVVVKCLGAVGQTTTAPDGSYALQLPGASLPCVLRVNDGQGRVLHSVAQDSSRSTVANITPLTDLLLTRAAHMSAASAFDGYSTQLAAGLTPATLKTAQGEIVGLLNGTVDTSGVDSFISSPLQATPAGQAATDPHDLVLDKFSQRVTPARYAEWVRLLASSGPLPDPGPFKPELRLNADTVTLAPGGSLALSANLNYPPNVYYLRPPVGWTLVESDGGKLSADGSAVTTYTAPAKKGTYHVKAVRDDYVNVSATVTVIVTDFVPTLEVAERSVTLMPGQAHHFSADINYPPGVAYVRQPTSWKVVEADGGSITIDGSYVAPAQLGTYHVQVRRDDFPDQVQTVEVRVASYQSLDRVARPLRYLALEPERRVIRDAATWEAWKKSHQVQVPLMADDEVDFSKHMVVAIILPVVKQCGDVKLLDLAPVGSALQATVQFVPPPMPDPACAAVIWSPVWLLVTAQSDLPLTVVEK